MYLAVLMIGWRVPVQPTGLLTYLDSTDDVPDDDVDRINVRDNLKLAQVMLLV